MIYHKKREQPDRKTHPLIGLLLFFISIILLLTTGVFGLIYGFFHNLFKKGFRGLGEYFLKIAISVDQLGNVLMQHLLNLLWIKQGGYSFGNRDETISSALGRNKRSGTLTGFGRAIDRLLDLIDPNHSLDSIDYYIEPSDQIIEAVSWVHLEDGQILSSRSEGKSRYYIPGGKRMPEEQELEALTREIEEEMGVVLKPDSISLLGIFEAPADAQPPGTLVRLSCYTGLYEGTLKPSSEIREIVWLTYQDRNLVAPADQLVFDFLYQKGMLN
ncbi:NUDIX hydrolase [Robiginitalea sp.]|uniref:NUDIX hydrolase n=1 Tax=Robiginitalea sp. TaxID=1902411 RepID=UPI003C73AEAF